VAYKFVIFTTAALFQMFFQCSRFADLMGITAYPPYLQVSDFLEGLSAHAFGSVIGFLGTKFASE